MVYKHFFYVRRAERQMGQVEERKARPCPSSLIVRGGFLNASLGDAMPREWSVCGKTACEHHKVTSLA